MPTKSESPDTHAVAHLLGALQGMGWKRDSYELHHSTFPGGSRFVDPGVVFPMTVEKLVTGGDGGAPSCPDRVSPADFVLHMWRRSLRAARPDEGLAWLQKNPFTIEEASPLHYPLPERQTRIVGQLGQPSSAYGAREVVIFARESVVTGKRGADGAYAFLGYERRISVMNSQTPFTPFTNALFVKL